MDDRYFFRAKRIDNGEWVKGYLVETRHNTYHDGYRIIDKDGINYDELDYYEPIFISYVIDESTICQYTGMTDKNGHKIWENDILVAHLDEKFPEDETYEHVIWHESGFCTMEKNSTDCEPLDGFDTRYFAVCGNIFDNAELLERKE